MKNETQPETNVSHTPKWEFVKLTKIGPEENDSWHVYMRPDPKRMYTTICFVDKLEYAELIASAPALLKENQELKEMIENKGAQIDQSIENWNALKHEYDKMEAQYKYCQELNAELLAAVKIAKFHVPSINYKSHWDIIQSAINKTESK